MKLAVCLVFCLGLALARVEEWSWLDLETQQSDHTMEHKEFRSGVEFHYMYNGQMTTGIPGSSQQHSGTRVKALVAFIFQNSNTCVMQMLNVKMGKINDDVPEPRKMVPFEMFEEIPIEQQHKTKLMLPIKFTYDDGMVTDVVFDGDDQPWSANIKRGILNMVQVNMQKRRQMDTMEEQRTMDKNMDKQKSTFYRVMEETIEGDCETLYTINEQPMSETFGAKVMKVKKSINFEKCTKRPTIKYNFRFSDPCPTCPRKHNDEEKFLKSSTVSHFDLVGTTQKFMIDSCRVESEYTFVPMTEESNVIVTYVNQTLKLMKTTPLTGRVEEPRRPVDSDSDMIYTLDWDIAKEKFHMEDDMTLTGKTMFDDIVDKVEMAVVLLKRLVQLTKENVDLESLETFDRLVTLFRTCTKQELEQIKEMMTVRSDMTSEERKKLSDLVPHILAICGSKTCVQRLVEKILTNQVPKLTAIMAVKDLMNIRTPSKEIIEELLKLSDSDMCERHFLLKQATWLTIGSLMNGLCSNDVDVWAREMREMKKMTPEMKMKLMRENVDDERTKMDATVDNTQKFCPRELKERYVQLLVTKLHSTTKWEERVTYLKTLANAGLDVSIFELEKIILNKENKFDTFIRTEAVLALRQLKDMMPKKVQKVLMPILMSKVEPPTLRTACAYMIMQTMPERAVLDQVAKMVHTERNMQVASFVHSLMTTLANSTNPCEKKLAADLTLALRLTRNINTTPSRFGKVFRMPIRSHDQKLGLDLNLVSMFSQSSYLPKYLTATLHSNVLGFWNKYLMTFGLVNEGMDTMLKRFYEFSGDYETEMRDIFTTMNIQDFEQHTKEPKAMLYMRFKDQDYGFLPIKEELIRMFLSGEYMNMQNLESKLRQGAQINFNKATMLHEMTMKVPTTMGMPMTITVKVPMMATIKGEMRAAVGNMRSMNIDALLKPSMIAAIVTDIECWSPIVNHGLKIVNKLKIAQPIDATLKIDMQTEPKTIRLVVRPPTTRRELVTLETLPVTYTKVLRNFISTKGEPDYKIVNGEELNRVHTFKTCVGRKIFGVDICCKGHVHHTPAKTLTGTPSFPMSGRNKIVVYAEPAYETPEEIVVKLTGKFLRPTINDMSFEEMYNTQTSYDREEEMNMDRMFRESTEYPTTSTKSMLMTKLRVDIETRSRRTAFDLMHKFDTMGRYGKLRVKLARSPVPESNTPYMMCLDSEMIHDDMETMMNQGRCEGKTRLTWGTTCESNNHVTLRSKCEKTPMEMNFDEEIPELLRSFEEENMRDDTFWSTMSGSTEQCRTEECRRHRRSTMMTEDEDESSWFTTRRSSMKKNMMKYHIDVEYNNVHPIVKNYTNKLFNMLKHHFYEQTELSQINVRNQENKIRMMITVDPVTKQHINITIRTPKENCIMRDIPVPIMSTLVQMRKSCSRRSPRNMMHENMEHTQMYDDEEMMMTPREKRCTSESCLFKQMTRRSDEERMFRRTDEENMYNTEDNIFNTKDRMFNTEDRMYNTEERMFNTEFESTKEQKPVLKHKMIETDNHVCISMHRLPQCPRNTRSTMKTEKRVEYFCTSSNDERVRDLESRIRFGERIGEIENMTPNKMIIEHLPTKCTSVY